MRQEYNDGGRQAAGYRGYTRDCVCRAIAIATGKPYQEVYDAINILGKDERITQKRQRIRSSARGGVNRKTYDRYLKSLGWEWVATMGIGTGCKVHLADGELPMGRLIVRLSRHIVAVIDGVIHDTGNPARGGTRCVYGYYRRAS